MFSSNWYLFHEFCNYDLNFFTHDIYPNSQPTTSTHYPRPLATLTIVEIFAWLRPRYFVRLVRTGHYSMSWFLHQNLVCHFPSTSQQIKFGKNAYCMARKKNNNNNSKKQWTLFFPFLVLCFQLPITWTVWW